MDDTGLREGEQEASIADVLMKLNVKRWADRYNFRGSESSRQGSYVANVVRDALSH